MRRFFSYTRMTLDTFDFILKKIDHRLGNTQCNWHKWPTPTKGKTITTLRWAEIKSHVSWGDKNGPGESRMVVDTQCWHQHSQACFLRAQLHLFIWYNSWCGLTLVTHTRKPAFSVHAFFQPKHWSNIIFYLVVTICWSFLKIIIFSEKYCLVMWCLDLCLRAVSSLASCVSSVKGKQMFSFSLTKQFVCNSSL